MRRIAVKTGGMLVAALAALASPAAAAAPVDHLWARIGASEATMSADLAACAKEARRAAAPARGAVVPGVVAGGVVAGAAGGAAAYLLEAYLARHQFAPADDIITHLCMDRRGYAWLPLEPSEIQSLAELKGGDARAAWIDKFYAGAPGARIQAALKPVVPPLPEGRPEALVVDGLRIDPAALRVAKGVVGDGETVLSGPVQVARTGLTPRPTVFPGRNGAAVDAGAIFYQVVGPTADDRQQSYWCGPFHAPNGGRAQVACLTTSDQGYALWETGGAPPFAGPPVLGGRLIKAPETDFEIEPSEAPRLGPFTLTLTAGWLNFYNVQIVARIKVGGRKVAIFTAPVPYGPDGVAIVPFWTHTLVLRRVIGQGVTAELRPGGDGRGWLDVKPPT